MSFSGRKQEIEQLQTLLNKAGPSLAIIYGRRRIGKSRLIAKALEKSPSLFFEGLEHQGRAQQIQNFLSQLAFQTKTPLTGQPTRWRDAFMELLPFAKDSITIVFDEFQWMANYRSDIVSDLKMVWDQYLSKKGNIKLILCGSIASFMIKKVLQSKALYGRSDLVIHLKPFSLAETRLMLSGRSEEEALLAHILVGGVPKYLELLSQASSVFLGMQEQGFRPNGYFVGEYERIFVSHFGSNEDYGKIIQILAEHAYGLTRPQICQLAKIPAGGGLTNQLYDLETAGFIRSHVPFHKKKNSKQIIYCLMDPYMRFYHAFIKPNRKKIDSDLENIFTRISQTQAYSSWLGRSFEYLCADHAKKISEILGFSGIDYSFGPYFLSGQKDQKGIQIDLLFDRADHVINLCEIKYTQTPPGLSLIPETEKKVELIRSITKKTIQKILLTKTFPSKDLLDRNYFYRVILARELF